MSNDKPSVLVLSSDAELDNSIHSILHTDYEVLRAASVNESLSILDKHRPAVCLIDFSLAQGDGNLALSLIKKHKKNIVVILICPRDKRGDLFDSKLSNETFRTLFSPLAAGQTRLAVQAAFKQSKNQIYNSNISQARPVAQNTTASNKLIPILASIGVLTLAGLTWWFLQGKKDPSVININAQTNPTIDSAPQKPIIKNISPADTTANNIDENTDSPNINQQLLAAAQQALDSGRSFPPVKNNALSLYLEVINNDPSNSVANTALDQLAEIALGELDLHIASSNISQAKISINNARKLTSSSKLFSQRVETGLIHRKMLLVNNADLAFTDERLDEARSLINTAKGIFGDRDDDINSVIELLNSQQAGTQGNTEVNRLVNLTRDAISNRRLLSSGTRSARYYIRELEKLDSQTPELSLLRRNMSAALLAEARRGLANNDPNISQRYIDAAASYGADSKLINSAKQKLTELKTRIEQEQKLQERINEERLAQIQAESIASQTLPTQTAPSQTVPSIEKPVEPATVNIDPPVEITPKSLRVKLSDLTTVKRTDPVYPLSYEQQGLKGTTDISFTINKQGKTEDIKVINVKPDYAIEFGAAAIAAVTNWEFEPYQDTTNTVREANTKIRLRFE